MHHNAIAFICTGAADTHTNTLNTRSSFDPVQFKLNQSFHPLASEDACNI